MKKAEIIKYLSILTLTSKFGAVLLLLALLTACAPMNSVSSTQDIETRNALQNRDGDLNHEALATYYKNLAENMHVKVQEQKKRLQRKSDAVLFSKNRYHIKSRSTYKIREYEKAEKESLARAAYHRAMAGRESLANPSQPPKQIDKARIRLKNTPSTDM